jgi:hypothetical protein
MQFEPGYETCYPNPRSQNAKGKSVLIVGRTILSVLLKRWTGLSVLHSYTELSGTEKPRLERLQQS